MPTSPRSPKKPAPVGVLRPGMEQEWAAQNPEYETPAMPSAAPATPANTQQDLSWLKPYEGQTLSKPYVPIENWVAAPLNPSVQWGLYHAGWEVEKPKDFVSSIPEDWLDTKGTRELTDYSYSCQPMNTTGCRRSTGRSPTSRKHPASSMKALKRSR